MKKWYFLCVLTLFVGFAVGLSSCEKNKKAQTEKSVSASDCDGVLPEPAPLIAENCISTDRQAMFLKCDKDDSMYRWYETTIVFKDFLDADPDGSAESIINIFQKITVKGKGADTMVYTFKHNCNGTTEIDSVAGFWIEDFPLNDEPIAIKFSQAFDKLMQANLPKPHSRYCVLRKQVGPVACNPQYIFGNTHAQIYVDAKTGDVSVENPAFKGSGFGMPLGEWP